MNKKTKKLNKSLFLSYQYTFKRYEQRSNARSTAGGFSRRCFPPHLVCRVCECFKPGEFYDELICIQLYDGNIKRYLERKRRQDIELQKSPEISNKDMQLYQSVVSYNV